MTEKLYYSMPYLKCCKSSVLSVTEDERGAIVVLDKTIFYPEGGGQPCDLGKIDGIEVLHVYEKDDLIYHVLKERINREEVDLEIDFNRRFDHMQQHSGEHLIAAMFFNLYGLATTGFHMGNDYVNIDLITPELSIEKVRKAEEAANDYIYKNLKIKAAIIEKEILETLPLRKTPTVEEDIRLVEIDGIDYSPCCGTHVFKTGEIGIIKIVKTEKYKGMLRIYFKAGKRAYLDLSQKNDIIMTLTKNLSTGESELTLKINNLQEELSNLYRDNKALREGILLKEGKDLLIEAKDGLICKGYIDKSFEDLKIISKYLVETSEKPSILYSLKELKAIFCSGTSPLDCGKIFKENISSNNGRGGGNKKQAQGNFEDQISLEKFIKVLIRKYQEI
ncbi:MAG TPA: DHHA1 domain-containing protein [Clostridiaceae bacterium]